MHAVFTWYFFCLRTDRLPGKSNKTAECFLHSPFGYEEYMLTLLIGLLHLLCPGWQKKRAKD